MENLIITHLKANAQNFEMWTAYDQEKKLTVGHIFMNVEINNKIKFFDFWVHPDYRRKGIYRRLWEKGYEYTSKTYQGYTLYAWCKEASLPLLIETGFEPGEVVTYVEKKI